MKEIARFDNAADAKRAMAILEATEIPVRLIDRSSSIHHTVSFSIMAPREHEAEALEFIYPSDHRPPLPGEQAEPPPAKPSQAERNEARLTENFCCVKCEHGEALIRRMGERLYTPNEYGRREFFLALTCASCGYTEFYDTRILGEKHIFLHIWESFAGGD